jgi:hypothetical protein
VWATVPWAAAVALLAGVGLLVPSTGQHRLGLMVLAISLLSIAVGGFIAWVLSADGWQTGRRRAAAKVRVDWERFDQAFREYVRRNEESASADGPQSPERGE